MPGPTNVKLTTVPAEMAANWRVAMFALSNLFLSSHRRLSGHRAMGPAALLVYVTVSVANIQKLMRERVIPPEYSATAVLPREHVVPISRSAIAATTGLPRETVRRNVARLIEEGLLMEDERGGITVMPGMIANERLEPLLDTMLTDFVRAAEWLLRTGVIKLSPDDPA